MIDQIVVSNIPLAEIATAIGTLGGSVFGYEYRKYRENQQSRKNTVEKWFDDCQDIAGRGIYTVHRARWRSDIEYDTIVDDLDEFGERLLIESKNHLDEIPPEIAENVASLSQIYSKATNVAQVSSQKEGIELIIELFEMAQREFSSDVNLSEVFTEASNISDQFQQLLSIVGEHGMEEEEFTELIEEMFTEWDSDEFAYLIALTTNDNSDVDETIQQTIRMFLEIVESLSDMTYTLLEDQKNKHI